MACRNMEKGEEARKELAEDTGSEQIILKKLDLGSLASVQQFAKEFNDSKEVSYFFFFLSIFCAKERELEKGCGSWMD